MAERIWAAGAIVTLLLGAGLFVLLLFGYLKYGSVVVLIFGVTIFGGLIRLSAETIRIFSSTGVLGTDRYFVYAVHLVLGNAITVVGVPLLAVAMTDRDALPNLAPVVLGAAAVTLGVLIWGAVIRFPAVIAASRIMEAVVIGCSAFWVFVKRDHITNDGIRRIVGPVAALVMLSAPITAFRLFYWSRSVAPFGNSLPTFSLLVAMMAVVGYALVATFRTLVINGIAVANTIDREAVTMFNITSRECDIILHIYRGLSNEDIAARLYISPSTVKNHIYHIYQKTGSHNRIELLNVMITNARDDYEVD